MLLEALKKKNRKRHKKLSDILEKKKPQEQTWG